MSCMMMNPEPLAALANAIETGLNCGFSFYGFEIPDSLSREFSDCRVSGTYFSKRIYRKLYGLNAKAYNSRYPDDISPESDVPPDIDVNQYTVHEGPEYTEHGYAVRP